LEGGIVASHFPLRGPPPKGYRPFGGDIEIKSATKRHCELSTGRRRRNSIQLFLGESSMAGRRLLARKLDGS
jgi:hypothetical protein